jgi:hypothetical protein
MRINNDEVTNLTWQQSRGKRFYYWQVHLSHPPWRLRRISSLVHLSHSPWIVRISLSEYFIFLTWISFIDYFLFCPWPYTVNSLNWRKMLKKGKKKKRDDFRFTGPLSIILFKAGHEPTHILLHYWILHGLILTSYPLHSFWPSKEN